MKDPQTGIEVGDALAAVERYRQTVASLIERDKAAIQADIWRQAPAPTRKQYDFRALLAKLFGETPNAVGLRATLFNGGDDALPFWERVHEDPMPVRTALELWKAAKRLHVEQRAKFPTRAAAVTHVLKEYDALPFMRTTQSGGVYRTKASEGSRVPSRKKAAKAAHKSQKNGQLPTSPREFFAAIRQQTAAYVSLMTVELTDTAAEQIYDEFEFDLKLLLDEFKSKVDKARREAKKADTEKKSFSEATLRRHLRESFQELSLQCPKPSESIDIKKVKKQYRVLAALYHPDKNPEVDLTPKFQAATEAYDFICNYNREHTTEKGT